MFLRNVRNSLHKATVISLHLAEVVPKQHQLTGFYNGVVAFWL